MGPYWSLFVLICLCGSSLVPMHFYAILWVLVDPYVCLCVYMDSNGSLWLLRVLLGPYASLFVPIGPCWSVSVFISPSGSLYSSFLRSLCVLMDFNGSLCVLKTYFAFFWVLMGFNRSVCVLVNPYESSKFLVFFYGYYGSFYKSFNVFLDFDKSLCVLIDSIWSL